MRKHNGGRWADFCPLSNVMVCPTILMQLYVLNGQSNHCSGCIICSSRCSSPRTYAHRGRLMLPQVRGLRNGNVMIAFSRWRTYSHSVCRRCKRPNRWPPRRADGRWPVLRKQVWCHRRGPSALAMFSNSEKRWVGCDLVAGGQSCYHCMYYSVVPWFSGSCNCYILEGTWIPIDSRNHTHYKSWRARRHHDEPQSLPMDIDTSDNY